MTVAAAILLVACLVRQVPMPSLRDLGGIMPYPLLVGGACGALILSCVLFALPQVGSAGVIVLFILGQLLAAVLLDHFAVLGIARHAISLQRLAGIAAVAGGAFLVVRG
jgi:transporter family-2 protein